MSTVTDPASTPVTTNPIPTSTPDTTETPTSNGSTLAPADGNPIDSVKVVPRPHGPGLVITPGFIFLNAVPVELGDVTRTAIGYYPFFKALISLFTATPDELVVRSSGTVGGGHAAIPWEGKQQSVLFTKTNPLAAAGNFSWIIFEDAETQLVDSIVGAAKLALNDDTQTFVVKRDAKNVVFEADGWKYESIYYCE